jgi:pSer/pThr/pTyr-binding forkhead associated (FHA) protein
MSDCPKCGTRNEVGNRFCKQCGRALGQAALDLPDDDTLIMQLLQSEHAEPRTKNARIWVLDSAGEQVEQVYELDQSVIVIGRRHDCAIVLPSSTVSRRHAQVRRRDDLYLLSDLGSTNGTLLNREPVIGEEPLGDRDEIAIGTYKLIFRYD